VTTTLSLLRRWVVEYFNGHNAGVARQFVAPDYALSIGDVVFAGRDGSWLPAVDVQFRAYPGMGMTVHQTLAGDGWAAIWFTEHGATEGRAAAWSGVGIYRSTAPLLTACVAQEDYLTRRRQIKSGVADAIDPPAVAPWDTLPEPRNPEAEAVVLDWLSGGWPRPQTEMRCDDDHITGIPLQFDVATTQVGEMLSSGNHVAFNVRQTGTWLGGLPAPATGPQPATLDCNGILRVENGRVVAGRVIRDRMGLWNRVRAAA